MENVHVRWVLKNSIIGASNLVVKISMPLLQIWKVENVNAILHTKWEIIIIV